MEVQSRTDHSPRQLSGRAACVWAQRWALLALATVLTLAALVVEAQPIRSPWWTYADADAAYTASALNLMLGREMTYLDHPGLPITEAVAVAAGVEALVSEGSLSASSRLRYVDRTLLDLDGARGLFRGFAVAFYLLGALAAFVLAARLFGHWTWGLANGLLWLAAPGLIPMSIQLRPDVLLSALCLVFAFAIARAIERRSSGWYAAAALLVGFTTMVKLHALALLLPLLVAALWRPPSESEQSEALSRVRRFVQLHRFAVLSIAGLWLALAVLLNVERFPFRPTGAQLAVTLVLLVLGLAALGAAEAAARYRVPRFVRRAASRLHALLIGAFVVGLLIPVTLDVQDGVRALVYVIRNVSGQGVQQGIEPFSTPFSALDGIVGTPAMIVFCFALLAGVVGVLRREPVPVVWAVAALATGVFAYARPPNVHYFAPAFVFSALALLWLLQREPRGRVPALAWILVLYFVWPAWDGRLGPAEEQRRSASTVATAKRYVDAHLAPGEFALVPSYWPFADSRYFELVEIYVDHSPEYPYRYLPTTGRVRSFQQPRQMRPRFYIGPEATDITAATQVDLGDLGRYTIVPRQGIVAEIVSGPGVTESW